MRDLFRRIELVELLVRDKCIHFGPRLRVAKHQETQYGRQRVSDEHDNVHGNVIESSHNAPIFSRARMRPSRIDFGSISITSSSTPPKHDLRVAHSSCSCLCGKRPTLTSVQAEKSISGSGITISTCNRLRGPGGNRIRVDRKKARTRHRRQLAGVDSQHAIHQAPS
jgi:hypothetical protein